jgi:hypothetical protein
MLSSPSSQALTKTTAPSASIDSLKDAVEAGDEPHERFPTRLDRTQAQILAFVAQKVERHERGLRSAAIGHERAEVAQPRTARFDFTLCYLPFSR